jgi:hypothetical protein
LPAAALGYDLLGKPLRYHASSSIGAGLFTLIEVVEQLRGSAGARQVAEAKYGYLSGVGGAMQNNFSAILGEV